MRRHSLRIIFIAAAVYLALGLVAGIYFREVTKGNNFDTETHYTQLATLHTHLLMLGFFAMLIILALEKIFSLSRTRQFAWFFWVYNSGVMITVGMMVVIGSLQVIGDAADSAALSGIAGLGHIVITAGLVLFMFSLSTAISSASKKKDESTQ